MKARVDIKNGFTLTYEGARFTEEGIQYSSNPLSKMVENADEIAPKTFQFCEDFNNIGALIMRFHFGQSQRMGLLTQLVRSNYGEYAIDKVGEGADQTDFFDVPKDATGTIVDSLKLHQLASYPLGEAKILNRLTQAIHERNTQISGEQGLFGTIHTAVWQPVLSLAGQLGKSDFAYLPCPADITKEQYEEIAQSLREGQFSLNEDKSKLYVQDQVMDLVMPSGVKILVPEKEGSSFQGNGLLIQVKNSDQKPGPLGWFIHVPSHKILKQQDTEDLIRLIRLAEGKFHQLTPYQQKILMSGRLEDNERVRFTQNRQLNAMLSIFSALEKEFNFDPRPLINNVLKQVAKATHKSLAETDVLDDVLTGIIQTEMVQHLIVSRENSQRKPLPPAFNLDFRAIQNNAKALVYAFDLKDGKGMSGLQSDDSMDVYYQDVSLPDLGIKGHLLAPSLTDSRHVAALLSTAIMVSEQMILEQLIPAAIQDQPNEEYAKALKTILANCLGEGGELAYDALIQVAKKSTQPFGLQNTESDELIKTLRQMIGTDHLIKFAKLLGTEKHSSPQDILINCTQDETQHYSKGLKNVHIIGSALQALPGVSAIPKGSRGLVSGTSIIIEKLFPELADSLQINRSTLTAQPRDSESFGESDTRDTPIVHACPFLIARQRPYNAPKSSGFFAQQQSEKSMGVQQPDTDKSSPLETNAQKQAKISKCTFFTVVTVTVLSVASAILALGS